MSLPVPPLPSSGEYIASVSSSCRALRLSTGIDVPPSAVEDLLRSPALAASFARLGTVHGVNFPLAFPSVKSELNFLGTLALLNFASGYRAPLHAATGRGAYDTIRTLVMGMYIDSDSGLMSARGWEQITTAQIASLMNISLHQEKAHPTIPGLVVGELGGPLNELVGLIKDALKGTGQVLIQGGYDDLGAFIAEALEESRKAGASQGTGPLPDVILERLVKAIPAFQDMAVVNGQRKFLITVPQYIRLSYFVQPYICSRRRFSWSMQLPYDLATPQAESYPSPIHLNYPFSPTTSCPPCSFILAFSTYHEDLRVYARHFPTQALPKLSKQFFKHLGPRHLPLRLGVQPKDLPRSMVQL